MQPEYEHTQKAPLHLLIWCTGIFVAVMGLMADGGTAALLCIAVALATFLVASMFKWLMVRDEGQCLALRYGPLRVFKASIPYGDISDVQPAKSTLLDGWGIHYLPGRGWTYNLWGFDCAKLRVKGVIVRIGSDDVPRLVEFLQAKTSGRVAVL